MSLLAVWARLSNLPADQTILDSIGDALRRGPQRSETLMLLLGASAIIGGIALVARFYGREMRSDGDTTRDYLMMAVDVLGLNQEDRHDLKRVAARARWAEPAAMLLSPANLAHAVSEAGIAVDDPPTHERIGRLCRRLFGVSLPRPAHQKPGKS